MPQIYDVLKQEHREMEQMLEQMVSGKADGKLFGRLYTMMTAHQQAEEKAVYPDLMKPEQTHETTLEGIEEHHVADMILKEMQKLQPKDEVFKAKLSVLQENVKHHLKEEEKTLFPQAKKAMDKQWAEQTAERYEQQEQAIKQKLQAKMTPMAKSPAKTMPTRAASKPKATTAIGKPKAATGKTASKPKAKSK